MANLIHLSQIKGGKQLRTELDQLLISYDAYKVLTDIAKEGGGNYNANELLTALNTAVADIQSQLGAGGSVSDQLAALKTEIETSIETAIGEEATARSDADTALQTAIDAINNKVIKDRVKIAATLKAATPAVPAGPKTVDIRYVDNGSGVNMITVKGVVPVAAGDVVTINGNNFDVNASVAPVGDSIITVSNPGNIDLSGAKQLTYTGPEIPFVPESLVISGDVATLVPSVDTTQKYNMYTADNKVVKDQTGRALTYDFTFGTLSGVPSVLDPSDNDTSDGIAYVPITSDVEVKLFPIGSFKFSELKEDYLLDNVELNTVAYDNAIDEIVVGLAEDKELIDQIAALVGTQAIQDQIKAITDALDARIVTLEGEVSTLTGDSSVAGSVDAKIEAVRAVLAKSVEDETTRAEAAEAALEGKINDLANKSVKDAVRVTASLVAGSQSVVSEMTGNFSISSQTATDFIFRRTATEVPYTPQVGDRVSFRLAGTGEYTAELDVIELMSAGTAKLQIVQDAALEAILAGYTAPVDFDVRVKSGEDKPAQLVLPGDFDTLVPSVDKSRFTKLYAMDGSDTGLSYDFMSEGIVGPAPTQSAAVQLFAYGSFKLGELPEAYLLDNVTEESLIRAIEDKKLQDAIDALEANVGGNVTEAIEAEKDRAEAAEAALQDSIDALAAKKTVSEDVTVSADGATALTIVNTPNAEKVVLFINGMRYYEGKAFTVDRAAKTITWTFTAANGGFDLLAEFEVVADVQIG